MGIFGLRIEKKKDCDVWNHHPRFCSNAKKLCKITKIKFGTKNALFGYFRL